MAEDTTTNALGLDFSEPVVAEKHTEPEKTQDVAPELSPKSPTSPKHEAESAPVKPKGKPYVNPDRVKTGGSQRVQ